MARFKDPKHFSKYESKEEDSEEEDYSEEEEEDSEEDDEDVPSKEPRKDAVYNTTGLHEKLEEFGWPDNVDWIEKLCINYHRDEGLGDIDVNDDLAREMAFYTQALEGTREAYGKFLDLKIPFLRPPDYYAEMVKSDTHMLKVKDKLLFQKQKIEEIEERKKTREAKKLAKAVQTAKLKERAKQKKQDVEAVKKWRKMRVNSGFKEGRDDLPLDLEEKGGGRGAGKKFRAGVAPGDRSGGKRQGKSPGKGKNPSGNKREFRDSKFGFGGRKRMTKQNTAESAADDSRSGLFGSKKKFRRS